MKLASEVVQVVISLKFSATATMANEKGRTKIASKRNVIPVTASHRRPSSQRWSVKSMGQVATTIMVAHTTAPRNGRRIQTEAAINANRNTTASVSRVSSNCRSAMEAPSAPIHCPVDDAPITHIISMDLADCITVVVPRRMGDDEPSRRMRVKTNSPTKILRTADKECRFFSDALYPDRENTLHFEDILP